MTKHELLAEVEQTIRATPVPGKFGGGDDSTLEWIGRAAAVLAKWNVVHGPTIWGAVADAQSLAMDKAQRGGTSLRTLLWQARADLQMEVGQLSIVVPEGQVFDYFEEIRRAIEQGRSEIFFVDPYLDAEFVGRYLPHVASGVAVRLLASKHVAALLPAVELFSKQSGCAVAVRSSTKLHDRYLFVDRKACYLSGASFRDGARKSPAILTQIVDAFPTMWDTYDRLWADGKIERN